MAKMLANRNGYRQRVLYLKGVSLECVSGVCLWSVSLECVTEVCHWGVSLEGCLWGVTLGCVTEVCHWGLSPECVSEVCPLNITERVL